MADVEELARAQGWKGPEEFSGPPEKFKSAEDFLKVAEDYAPVSRERNRYLTEQLEKLNQKYEQTQSTLHKLADHHKKTAQLAYKRALRELSQKRQEAVELGDTDTFKKVDEEIQELQAAKPEDEISPANSGQSAQSHQETLDKWVSENEWFVNDITLHQAAIAAGNILSIKHPTMSPEKQLAEIKKMVMEQYPEKFESDKASKVSPVLGGDNYSGSGGRGRKKSYSDLPGDAKKACDDFVKQGLMTKDDYVKEYFEME
jgi:chromosome segregation ATPase